MHSNMQFAKTFLQRGVAWSEMAKRAVECGVGQSGGEQRSQGQRQGKPDSELSGERHSM